MDRSPLPSLRPLPAFSALALVILALPSRVEAADGALPVDDIQITALDLPSFAAEPSRDATKKADRSSTSVPEVPGDDIFGFTTPTDLGKAGDTTFGNENDGRVGKRGGSYSALNAKYEYGRTLSDNWWIAGSAFLAYNYSRDVPDLADVNRLAFDGLSFEIEGRILRRSGGNPFAISASVEPWWARIDGVTGLAANAFGAAFKLFVDAVVVPDKLYWGANLIWAPLTAEDPSDRSRWVSSSTTLVSSALTYQASQQLFVGAEVRLLAAFDSAFPQNSIGHAVYLGPTMLWKITDKVAFNTTFQPQIFGRSDAHPNLHLDLDNFERAQFRAKLSIALQ